MGAAKKRRESIEGGRVYECGGREGGIVGSGGDGLLCFLQSCLSMLPGEPFPHLSGRQVWNANGAGGRLHVLNSSETSRAAT